MTPDQPTLRAGHGPLLPRALSFLAPAVLVLPPVIALALASGEKNEAYEWLQHRVIAAEFATAFVSLLLWGCWRQGWPAAAAALLAVGSVVVAVSHGLPGMHGLLILAGGLVALGYGFASRRDPAPLLELVAVGLGSVLCFWAVSRLLWWQPFDVVFASWPNRMLFLAVTLLLVGLLCRFEEQAGPLRPGWSVRLIDGAVLLALAAAVLRTNVLQGNPNFPHHWGVYVVPADLVRDGHALLGEVPSQYGFLSTLLLAVLPTDDRFSAVYWVHCTLVWLSGAIVYFTLRTWLARWWWRLGAGFVTLSSVAFLCGDAPALSGPLPYPSIGAMRFIWVHGLLGYLLWWHRRSRSATGPVGPVLWIGSGLWLLGILWSVESAAYVTAVWLPAAALLAMPSLDGAPGRVARIRALLTGIGRSLALTGFLFALALAFIAVCYRFILGHAPIWSSYWEYAAAFSNGFGVLPIEPQGGVWVLVMLHTALLAAIVSLDLHRQRSAVALIWAAWGALWAVSTYFVSRSHINNIINLSPVLLMIVGVLGHAVRAAAPQSLVRPWLWLCVPPYVGAMLWLVLTNPAALQQQLGGYAVEPQAAHLLPGMPEEVTELVALCQQTQPGPYSIIDQASYHMEKSGAFPDHTGWLPLGSNPLYAPLPLERRHYYLDALARGRPGWLLFPLETDNREIAWIFEFVGTRYTARHTLDHDGWRAWYLVPRSDASPP